MAYVSDTNNITSSLVEAFASHMTPKSDLSLVGAFAQKTRPVKSKLPVLNVSSWWIWDYYDYIDATDDALHDIVEAYYEDVYALMEEEDKKKDAWLQSIEYTSSVEQATACYEEEYEYIEEWINDREINAEEAPYRKGSLQYNAREALQSYINELNGRDTSFGMCVCGYDNMDYDVDINGHTHWSSPFIEFCSCYKNAIPDDSELMVQLKTLQNNYKNSKDKIKPNLSSAYEAMGALRIKHEAYLAELKLGPM